MTEIVYEDRSRLGRGSMDWSAIWAGLFTFISIWSVFSFLGFALFATSSGAAQPVERVTDGMGIWAAILTVIAMFVAGLVTGKFAGLDGRYESVIHGMVMFGLSVAAVVVLTLSGSILFTGIAAGTAIHNVNLPAIFGSSGWIAFSALFLGWLAAMFGATSGFKPKTVAPSTVSNVRDMRPAA